MSLSRFVVQSQPVNWKKGKPINYHHPLWHRWMRNPWKGSFDRISPMTNKKKTQTQLTAGQNWICLVVVCYAISVTLMRSPHSTPQSSLSNFHAGIKDHTHTFYVCCTNAGASKIHNYLLCLYMGSKKKGHILIMIVIIMILPWITRDLRCFMCEFRVFDDSFQIFCYVDLIFMLAICFCVYVFLCICIKY